MTDSWTLRIGDFDPPWVRSAMMSGRIVLVSDNGPNKWADDGIRVVATGKVFRQGDVITRADVYGDGDDHAGR